MHLVTLLGIALTVIEASALVPQVVRLLRHKDTAGLSAMTTITGLVAMACWCIYTARLGDTEAFAASVPPALGWLATGATLVHLNAIPRARTALATLPVAAGIVVATVATVQAAGVAAAVGSCLWALPQALVALRHGRLAGVSGSSWSITLASALGWALYGLLSGHLLYSVASLVQVPASLVVLGRVAAEGRSRRPEPPAPASLPPRGELQPEGLAA